MSKLNVTTGYFQNGLPYARFGNGPRTLVIFGGGPDFAHKPPSGLTLRMVSSSFKRLAEDFTVYMVSRKPRLPTGYSMRDMSEDYATMIRDELGGPVDIIGVSSGGSYAQHLAADHPDLVRRLVIHSSAYRLGEEAKELQRRVGDLARQGKWRAAATTMIAGVYPRGVKKYFFKLLMWLFGKRMFGSPTDPSDGLVEVEAEDKHDFKSRLAEIKAPTLVIGGDDDFFYPAVLFRETAAGIPNARLVLYEGLGHNAMFVHKRQFIEDVLAFLAEGTDAERISQKA